LNFPFSGSPNRMRHTLESKDGLQFYHVALIDYLQEWDCNKKLERFVKT